MLHDRITHVLVQIIVELRLLCLDPTPIMRALRSKRTGGQLFLKKYLRFTLISRAKDIEALEPHQSWPEAAQLEYIEFTTKGRGSLRADAT